ncbi:MAG: hypothetical protein GY906_38170 [bacterium]|nr:hypothetical protein [bacterium]
MRKTLILTVVIGFFALQMGCQPASTPPAESTPTPRQGGTVVIGVASDVQNWNPYLNDTQFGDDLLRLIYPSLALDQVDYRDHPPTFLPNLASSWEWSEDHLTLTIHLDASAVWNDGVPVTSDDVLFTWQIQMNEELGWTGIYVKDAIDKLEAIDPHTVRFTFNRLYPYQFMDANEGLILPAHVWQEIPIELWEETDWAAQALSAGPFQLARHTSQQEIVLERNPNYWKDGLPYLDNVVWRIVPDQSGLVTQLLAGDLDFVKTVPARDTARIEATPTLRLIKNPDRGYGYIGWNNRHPFFSDPAIRRALTHAIDREAILDSIWRGYSGLSTGPVLSYMWAYNQDIETPAFDLDRARAILAEAGWSDSNDDGVLDREGTSFTFELMTNNESQTRRDVAMIVKDQLKLIGVDVRLHFIDFGSLSARQSTGQFDAYVGAWIEGTFIDLQDAWLSAAEGEPTYNYVRYSNAKVDELILEMNELPNFASQKPLVDEIQRLIVADQPYTFLYERTQISGLNTRVHGADINELSPYYNIEHWFVVDTP